MGHVYNLKKQLEIQIIGILEEIDSFYWPKMYLWKGDKNFGQGLSPSPKSRRTATFSWNLPVEEVVEKVEKVVRPSGATWLANINPSCTNISYNP